MHQMGECQDSIDAEEELTEDEVEPGLTNLISADAQGIGQLHTYTHPHTHAFITFTCYSWLKIFLVIILADFFPPGVIEQWQLMQAKTLNEKDAHVENQWQQLITDLQAIRAWLDRSEVELSQLRGLNFSTDIDTIKQRIEKLKVCLVSIPLQQICPGIKKY